MTSSSGLVCCVDIGGTKLLCAISDISGRVIVSKVAAVPVHSIPPVIVDMSAELVQALMGESGTSTSSFLGIGASMAGPTDTFRGIVKEAPNLTDWQDVPIADLLSERLGLRAYVENDANLAALGEYVYGAGEQRDPMAYVTVSTGVGGGLIIGGELFRGYYGSAGEIGHVIVDPNGPAGRCGHKGCVESLASGLALARRAREVMEEKGLLEMAYLDRMKSEGLSAKTVLEGAEEGNEDCARIARQGSMYLGAAFTVLCNFLDLQTIVVGGGLANHWESYVSPAIEFMRGNTFPKQKINPQVVRARLEPFSSVLGCVEMVKRRVCG